MINVTDAKPGQGAAPDLRRLRREARERFLAGRKAETQYGIQLSRVAKHVGDIVLGMSSDALAWVRHGHEIGRALKREIDLAPTGAAMRKILEEQTARITSIPRDAA